MKIYYLVKLIPPRPTFAADMTTAEQSVMERHVAYWKDLARKGTAIVFGPVFDPEGTWGLGIVQAESDDGIRAIVKDDPAVSSGLNRAETYPMLANFGN